MKHDSVVELVSQTGHELVLQVTKVIPNTQQIQATHRLKKSSTKSHHHHHHNHHHHHFHNQNNRGVLESGSSRSKKRRQQQAKSSNSNNVNNVTYSSQQSTENTTASSSMSNLAAVTSLTSYDDECYSHSQPSQFSHNQHTKNTTKTTESDESRNDDNEYFYHPIRPHAIGQPQQPSSSGSKSRRRGTKTSQSILHNHQRHLMTAQVYSKKRVVQQQRHHYMQQIHTGASGIISNNSKSKAKIGKQRAICYVNNSSSQEQQKRIYDVNEIELNFDLDDEYTEEDTEESQEDELGPIDYKPPIIQQPPPISEQQRLRLAKISRLKQVQPCYYSNANYMSAANADKKKATRGEREVENEEQEDEDDEEDEPTDRVIVNNMSVESAEVIFLEKGCMQDNNAKLVWILKKCLCKILNIFIIIIIMQNSIQSNDFFVYSILSKPSELV